MSVEDDLSYNKSVKVTIPIALNRCISSNNVIGSGSTENLTSAFKSGKSGHFDVKSLK
jgi:hypothetical protein